MQITKPNNGSSLIAAVMPWKGITIPNAAIITKTVANSELFTSIHVKKLTVEIGKQEILTIDLPGFSESEFQKINGMVDENAIIRVGQTVSFDDVLVAKGKKGLEAVTKEEQVLTAIFGHTSLVGNCSVRMPFKDTATVISVVRSGSRIFIYLTIKRNLAIGDVLVDKSGNEIVVADIVSDSEMPHVKQQWYKDVQMIITPPSQILKGMTEMYSEESLAVVHSIENPGFILLNFKKSKGGRSKKWEYRNETAVVGSISLQKKELLIEQKIDGVGIDYERSLNQQLMDGIRIKPSLVGLLSSNGLMENVKELLTIKSDSTNGYVQGLKALINDSPLQDCDRPASVKRLITFLQSLCFSFKAESDKFGLHVMDSDSILSLSNGEVLEDSTIDYKTNLPTKGGLFDQKIFGPVNNYECACGKYKRIRYVGIVCDKCGVEVASSGVRFERFGHITLAVPMINPLCKEEIVRFFKNLDELGTIEDKEQEEFERGKMSLTDFIEKMMNQSGVKKQSIMYHLPVLPPGLRPLVQTADYTWATSDLNDLYRRVVIRNNRVKRLMEIKAPAVILTNEARMLQESVMSIFLGMDKMKGLAQHLAESVELLYEKKVGYSGKGTVVPYPVLSPDQCGLPLSLALKLFEPHICRFLLKNRGDEDSSVKTIKQARKLITDNDSAAIDALKEVLNDISILVTSSDQTKAYGFKPILMDGEVIRLHPEAMKALALSLEKNRKVILHVPLLGEARAEVEKILFSTDKNMNQPSSVFKSFFTINTKDLEQIMVGDRGGEFALSEFDQILLSK